MSKGMYQGMVGLPRFSPEKVVTELKGLGITHVIYLTDFMTGLIVDRLIKSSPEITLVSVCREGEAQAIAAGLWMAGKKPLVVMQNSGFLESGDSVTGIAVELQAPILMLIGYRGFFYDRSVKKLDAPSIYIEPVLKAMDIPYHIIETDDDIPKITELQLQAEKLRKPVAALIAWESPLVPWPASQWEEKLMAAYTQ